MPWKVSDEMGARFDFVKRLEAGERMTDLCREFGISRKTGYKIRDRFAQGGVMALEDRSRRPLRVPHRTPKAVVEQLLALRADHPTWGPKKLKAHLARQLPDVRWPATSTIGEILKREGMIKEPRRRRRTFRRPTQRIESSGPNELWCMDYKGDFRLGDRTRCYPLTVSDDFSRMVLGCEACTSTNAAEARAVFEALFTRFGLPERIRSDNGTPFASTGLGNLTVFSAWLLRLGIILERIEPGKPQQNARHERMHLTLKRETTRPAAATAIEQQVRFDEWVDEFNTIRPHEGIGQRVPLDLYAPSPRPMPPVLELADYPLHDRAIRVNKAGAIQLDGRSVFLSKALCGRRVGLRELEESETWLVSYVNADLAFIDRDGVVVPF